MQSSSYKETLSKGAEAVKKSPRWIAGLAVLEFIALWLIFYRWNPWDVSGKYPASVASFMLFFGFMQLMAFFFSHSAESMGGNPPVSMANFLMKAGASVATIVGIVLACIILIYVVTHFPTLQTLVKYSLDLVILAGIVGVAYLLLRPVIKAGKTPEGRASLLTLAGKIVLYLPCLMIQIADWFKYQYSITTNTTWVLLAIEGALLALRFLLPMAIKWAAQQSDSKQLLKGPRFLDEETTVGTMDILHPDGKRNYEYSISCWFWITPQPPNTRRAYTKYTNIISFGDQPSVEYMGLDDVLRVTYKKSEGRVATVYETSNVPMQRWNNLVLNFDKGNMDVFLNGELVGSEPGVAPFMSFENIRVGEAKGIVGGVCNVTYSPKITHSRAIEFSYNAMKNLENPVI